MRPLRRPDTTPRLELTPLLDVVFLLLTFFIYCVVMMFHVEVLPVKFTSLPTAGAASPTRNSAITILRSGEIYLDRQKISLDQLDNRLAEIARQAADTKIVLAMEAGQGSTDRGPLYVEVWKRVHAAGLGLMLVGDKPAAPANGP